MLCSLVSFLVVIIEPDNGLALSWTCLASIWACLGSCLRPMGPGWYKIQGPIIFDGGMGLIGNFIIEQPVLGCKFVCVCFFFNLLFKMI